MKLKDKTISFGLTNTFYMFKATIKEMKDIVKEGGKIIPIMEVDTYVAENKHYKVSAFIEEIEEICGRKIIITNEEAEEIEADIMVIAPCSRKYYCKTCIFYI